MDAFKVDAKGRLSIPQEIREQFSIESGDLFFVKADSEHATIHFSKAQNPFDGPTQHAIEKYHTGRTRSLEEYAADRGINLDDE